MLMLVFIPVHTGILIKAETPLLFHEVPLHYVIVRVRGATSATTIIGLVFPRDHEFAHTYIQLILTLFSEHLSN
jgi:hypothetical protein